MSYSMKQKFIVASLGIMFSTAQVSAQDIAVSGETHVLIPDGSAAAESLGTIYFPIPVAGSAAGILFEIHNTASSGNLIISSITKSGAHAADFAIAGFDANTVPPGETVDFGVNCDPSAVGDRTVTITINSNDPDSEAAYTFNLKCFSYADPSELVPKPSINVGLLDDPKARSNNSGTTRFKAKIHVGNVGKVAVEDPVLQVFWSTLPYFAPGELAYEKPLKPFPAYTGIDDFKRKNVKVKLKMPVQSGYVYARIVSAGSVSEYDYTNNTMKMPFGDH